MRCQLLVKALRARGCAIDVMTTSAEGRRFLSAFGVEADILSEHYRVEFDARHNMARRRTEWRLLRYFFSSQRWVRDLPRLAARARGAALVVNDSFHPALLLSPLYPAGTLPPVVHIYGNNLRPALEQNFRGRLPQVVARTFQRAMSSCTDRAFARIEHGLSAPPEGCESAPRTFRVPPVVALPARSRSELRGTLGIGPGQRLAVAYLNPHFRDPVIAEEVEIAMSKLGLRLYGVGEGYAERPGWRAWDIQLADAVGAADLFVSAPGLGALAQARALGVPLVALVADQPEQAANLAGLGASDGLVRSVRLDHERRAERIAEGGRAVLAMQDRAPYLPTVSALDTWLGVFDRLLGAARSGAAGGNSVARAA